MIFTIESQKQNKHQRKISGTLAERFKNARIEPILILNKEIL